MRIGWLVDDPGYIGGAELTQAEFRAAVPEGVEVVDCPSGEVVEGLDRYVVHNHRHYSPEDLRIVEGKAVCYYHDLRPQKLRDAKRLCCSPAQAERMGIDATPIPPPVNLDRFRINGNGRQGALWLGRMFHGKGLELAVEWAQRNEPLDFYGDGPLRPPDQYLGPIPYEEVPEVLARYERLVFLPTAFEPFSRVVIEAWASGLRLTVNRNIGALYWIKEEPEALENASERFWEAVLA